MLFVRGRKGRHLGWSWDAYDKEESQHNCTWSLAWGLSGSREALRILIQANQTNNALPMLMITMNNETRRFQRQTLPPSSL